MIKLSAGAVKEIGEAVAILQHYGAAVERDNHGQIGFIPI